MVDSLMSKSRGLVVVVLLLCVCVVIQALGSPFTIVGQDTTTDVVKTSLSEGFSIPEITCEPDVMGLPCLSEEFVPITHILVFPKSAFHPPQA